MCIRDRYNGEIVDKLVRKHSVKINSKSGLTGPDKKDTKFIVTEYTNVLPVIVKNELKKRTITVAFKTTNNIKKRLGQRTHIPDEEKTGVYKLECDDCDKFYIGQTGRQSAERFKEHPPKSDISKTRSSYAQHLTLYNHKYSDFHTNFKLLHNCKKGAYMNGVEEYEMYKASKLQADQLLNDKVSFRSNLLYNTCLLYTSRCV